jgi:hypothetical protein
MTEEKAGQKVRSSCEASVQVGEIREEAFEGPSSGVSCLEYRVKHSEVAEGDGVVASQRVRLKASLAAVLGFGVILTQQPL